jgi:aminobenzoyl-glutamate utilization protein A
MQVTSLVRDLAPRLVQTRRDLHLHAEAGWTEFRTAALVIGELQKLGYEVRYGKELFHPEHMAGLPTPAELDRHMQRAIAQGADPTLVQAMAGGCTGVVATLHCGEGPTVAMRFDIDALGQMESQESSHRPAAEGFGSVNPGAMHACGHDGHTAIGLGVAAVLVQIKERLRGTIKLIFQPAEEGVRGARAMVEAGVVDDVDYLLGAHLGFSAKETGLIVCGTGGFLATSKLDAIFTGVPAHAGAAPQEGRNALLAAASASLNLHAIARHAGGASRINVGVLEAGTGRNVVPATATLKLETRGETTEIDAYMAQEAERIIRAAAAMWDVSVRLEPQGSAAGAVSDADLAAVVAKAASQCPGVTQVQEFGLLGGSEDFTWMMDRVQKRGGKATYLMIGSKIAAPHHDSRFDFDEAGIALGVDVLVRTLIELQNR